MVSSSDVGVRLFLAAMLGLGMACSVGVGEGSVEGMVTAPGCDLENEPYSLLPTFFGGEVLDVDDQLEIRIQRGGNLEGFSDGVRILVKDPTTLRESMLGAAIPLSAEGPVDVNLYLNETCPVEFDRVPINLEAVSGSITFTSLYAPEVSTDDVVIEATFDGTFAGAEGWSATLAGQFRFLFNRGRPAQRYP